MAKLRQVGNSLVVTIPAVLAKQFSLRAGDDVDVEADGDVLRIVPIVRLPRHRADGEVDRAAEARALLRRYHADLNAALERAEHLPEPPSRAHQAPTPPAARSQPDVSPEPA